MRLSAGSSLHLEWVQTLTVENTIEKWCKLDPMSASQDFPLQVLTKMNCCPLQSWWLLFMWPVTNLLQLF